MEREALLWRVVVVVLAVAVLATLAESALSRRQPRPQPGTLRISAQAHEEARPDVARVSLRIKAVGPTAKQAATAVADAVDALKAKLAELGVMEESLRTSELHLQEVTDHEPADESSLRRSYEAYRLMDVILRYEAFGKAPAVVDAAVADPATTFHGLAWEVQDDNKSRAMALAKATERARYMAEEIASAAGGRIVGIERISPRWSPTAGYEAGRHATASVVAAPPELSASLPAPEPGMALSEVAGTLRGSCEVDVLFLVEYGK